MEVSPMFQFMDIVTLRAVFEARGSGILPKYLGSTIRGILGHCIREFVCDKLQTKCFRCPQQKNCLYVSCFCSTGGAAGAVNPYVIYVHTQGKTEWKTGEVCVFDLTLFGKVAQQAGIYLDALQEAQNKEWGSSKIPFQLLQISDPITKRLIYTQGKLWLRNITPSPFSVQERQADMAMLTFDTPLRVVSGKELVEGLPFVTLVQFLTRRFSLMAKAFTDHTLEWNEKEMLQAAAKVQVVHQNWRKIPFGRYSINQKNNYLELPAQSGWILYEGELSSFTGLLEAGRLLHIGKDSTIGFGHYDIVYNK